MNVLEDDNKLFAQAVSFVNSTNCSLFLTGKAGTGKTTFLRYIKEHSKKKLAVVAPTGVAAINAGGVTIHSFFQIPPGTFIPTTRADWNEKTDRQLIYNTHQLLSRLRIRQNKQQLIRELDLLIIDEVSMVRCDLLDAIDQILRYIRRKNQPFGGVQMLYIGDLFQLPPVVQGQEMALLSEYYSSPFFFDALALKEFPPLYLELKKIYRQSDEQFIDLLNKIRDNKVSDEDLALLNSYYRPQFFSDEEGGEYITLASHNAIADRINQRELDNLPGKLYSFEAVVERDFPERSFPADQILRLREGAQIMFIKNDKGEDRQYYNGKIGKIESIDQEEIKIKFKEESGSLTLRREKWQNIRYDYNHGTDKVEEEEIGTFSQFPIRLAWAITIHKSQGLTFDRAVIDAGASFAAGQVYVALSRLRSLHGLVLRSRIFPSAISTHQAVLDFCGRSDSEEVLAEALKMEQKAFVFQTIVQAFDWAKLLTVLSEYLEQNEAKLFREEEGFIGQLKAAFEKIEEQSSVSKRFVLQLDKLLATADKNGFSDLHARVSAACTWFSEALDKEIRTPLKLQIEQLKQRKRTKKLQQELTDILISAERKQADLHQALSLSETMLHSSDISDWLELIRDTKEGAQQNPERQQPVVSAKKPEKGASFRISLIMFNEGNTIEEIARERGLAIGTIESHLTRYITTGEVDVAALVPVEKFTMINDYLEEHSTAGATEVRKALPEAVSYMQIRAVMMYRRKIVEKEKSV